MNLAQATLEAGDGGTVVHLGSATLPVPVEVAREQGLDAWAGKHVVVGIRPEDLHGPGDGHESAATLRAVVDRVESVGASLLVHFSVDAEPARSAGLVAATGGEHLEDVPLTGRTGASFCASFEPRSGTRAGDTVEIQVDTRRLHFFDPETETSLHAALEMA
jgi:multiple sugar transport system ATP-binding protein